MNKRAAASLLWFAAIWLGYEIVWSVTGVPRVIGPVIAAAVAGFVGIDPHGLFWPRSARAATTPVTGTLTVSVEQ